MTRLSNALRSLQDNVMYGNPALKVPVPVLSGCKRH